MDYLLTPLAVLPFPTIDPVIVQIGPIAVRWYGLAYVAGIILGWIYARRLVANERLWPTGRAPMTLTDLDDFLLWAAVGIVAGGRIGYVLFYDFASFLANPLSIFAVWTGGMSFHGGFLGTTIAIILFARSRQIPAWTLLDTVAAVVPVGLLFGRLANFINSELWGRPTDVPWAFVFPTGGPEPRHPSQLYEAALEGVVLFVVIWLLIHFGRKLKQPGFIAGTFVAGYAASRIFVEFFREPDAHIGYLSGGWLTMGMLLSLPMLAAGLWAMATAGGRKAASTSGAPS
ncbi:prolipoprotein diacylglyceryl transferase [Georhizobium profundi]|uniref:Phosphatidylglycerol--prolipoprotein diacylglyceryl transferase n=1 Tax=Georhizobium profundi TaxID=2341112 RepID=A0A3Q8XMU3_9HYPH|nr:prolipoprotein diacylglyceryl transferase [Georhizobium profundi]AZN71173.1 prolipoprotein diacylglyceryl transferase [Georhizobium profundi]